jgi:hypothetical protein
MVTDEKIIDVETEIEIRYQPATPEGLGLDPTSYARELCANFDIEWIARVSEKYPGAVKLAVGGNGLGPGYVTFGPSPNGLREAFQACEDVYAELAEHPEVWA